MKQGAETGTGPAVEIFLDRQRLLLRERDRLIAEYPVSTSVKGAGERCDSERTPRGRHEIVQKIGDGCPPNAVFVGREPTGEIYSAELGRRHPGRDWILTRILRLAGLETGFNRDGDVDTYRRMIYIHGAPDGAAMGVPGSRGCIRMRNADLLALYAAVTVGTPVRIREQ
ncbi:MAG: L,D-transpeptidase [Gammaproteobacteria bacterium]|nr:L,D-transpeptidase [Gammaproteobacteria bacterium]